MPVIDLLQIIKVHVEVGTSVLAFDFVSLLDYCQLVFVGGCVLGLHFVWAGVKTDCFGNALNDLWLVVFDIVKVFYRSCCRIFLDE